MAFLRLIPIVFSLHLVKLNQSNNNNDKKRNEFLKEKKMPMKIVFRELHMS